MFRFSTVDEAAEALATIEADYEQQCRAARAIAEEFFDARLVLSEVLTACLDHVDPGRVLTARQH
jgi:hypothetical protein